MSDHLSEKHQKQYMLLEACKKGSLSEVESLLEDDDRAFVYYARGNLPDEPYHSPLHIAINNGHTEVALRLISAGCNDYDDYDSYPDLYYYLNTNSHLHKQALHLAAEKDNVPVLRALLESGCDIDLYTERVDDSDDMDEFYEYNYKKKL